MTSETLLVRNTFVWKLTFSRPVFSLVHFSIGKFSSTNDSTRLVGGLSSTCTVCELHQGGSEKRSEKHAEEETQKKGGFGVVWGWVVPRSEILHKLRSAKIEVFGPRKYWGWKTTKFSCSDGWRLCFDGVTLFDVLQGSWHTRALLSNMVFDNTFCGVSGPATWFAWSSISICWSIVHRLGNV